MIEFYFVYQSGHRDRINDMFWFWNRVVHDINSPGGDYDTPLFG